MFCTDPYVALLKAQGYNVVRLPRADFSPLLLLADEGGKDLARMGHLTELLSGANAPPVKADTRAAGISGKRTAEMNIGLGLNLLGTIIGAMGGSNIGLDTQFKNAASAVFEFPDVLADDVSVVQLDQYLGKARINPASRYLKELLDWDELFVVTGTIKSRKFSVEFGTDQQGDIGLKVPAIQQVVGADVKVSGAAGSASKVTFEGSEPLVFGFQARRLVFEDGQYLRFEPVEAGSVGAKDAAAILGGSPEASLPPPVLLGRGTFVRI